MAKIHLAIRGNDKYSIEVIDTLKCLGGKNTYNLMGCMSDIDSEEGEPRYYYIEDSKDIVYCHGKPADKRSMSLDEFNGRWPYRPGDFIILKEDDREYEIEKMEWDNDEVKYTLIITSTGRKKVFAYEILRSADEPIVEKIKFDGSSYSSKVKLDLGEDYNIVWENGEPYVVRKNVSLPGTYEECCRIMGIDSRITVGFENITSTTKIPDGWKETYLNAFEAVSRLIICRDAYWKKLAYTPKWENKNETKYIVLYDAGNFKTSIGWTTSRLLVFPTDTARDTFVNNFKYLIDASKIFL